MAGASKPKAKQTSTAQSEDRRAVLAAIDSNIKLFALVVLVIEAGFLAALAALPATDVKLALVIMAVVGIVAIIAGVWLHRIDNPSALTAGLQPSALTPDMPLLNELVRGAIETVCRAVSLPQTPESAQLRAFIFRVEGNSLVCTHFWSPNPTREEVGLSFQLTRKVADDGVVVVRAALNREITRTDVRPLPADEQGIRGQVSPDLLFILAAPIFDANNQNVWGIVDFDAATEAGRSLLLNDVSDQVMFQLARHLRLMFALHGTDHRQGLIAGQTLRP